MTPDFLAATLSGDRTRQEALLGAAVPDDWPTTFVWVRRRLHELRAEPGLQPWLLRAIVLQRERRMVGHIGFHGRPGEKYLEEFAPGGAEFGYTVFLRDRRRGYAREACTALMDWAYRTHGVARFVVSISPTNVASLELARGLGFERVGSHVDEEDGPEDIFRRDIDAG
jgi:RimJ/RimL family protein N-acetyltransferase